MRPSPEEFADFRNALRDKALEGMAATARNAGIDEAAVQAAVAESKRTNSDKPMQDLIMPALRAMFPGLIP